MSFDASVGGVASNCYVTVEQALAFFAGELGASAFVDATLATQQTALRTATSWLDRLDWIGYRSTRTQRLKWPRAIPVEIDEQIVRLDEIPPRLVRATCRLALRLLQAPDVLEPLAPDIVTRERVGPIETEYGSGSIAPRQRIGLARFPDVLSELGPLLEQGGGWVVARA